MKHNDALDRITYIVSTAFLDGTGLNGLRPLMDALNGNEAAWNRLVSNTAQGYIPLLVLKALLHKQSTTA